MFEKTIKVGVDDNLAESNLTIYNVLTQKVKNLVSRCYEEDRRQLNIHSF